MLINLLSDLIADYTSNLILHYEKQFLTQKADYQMALGFSTGINNLISLIFQALGASLIVLLHHNFVLFGLINAVSFFLAGAVLWHDRKILQKIDQTEQQSSPNQSLSPESFFKIFIKLAKLSLLTPLSKSRSL
ncbi:hypothetical protein HU830_03735 [Lactobacillus sp. DCY120]|uniref:Uncharacterized protein n=1 Tax=Bombilactobacillus apium TaxID=2675299 RepID=A0A850RBW8_9LACO|nr:hypothetical protein [Bombilactobacillus apium]NVY96288.1 hypothetical protein [Bombilactobacillus apium]